MSLFALGQYDEAAVPMYTVLSNGPGWDWTTLAGLYPSVDVYTYTCALRAIAMRRRLPRPPGLPGVALHDPGQFR